VRGAPYTARPWFIAASWTSGSIAAARDELIGFRIARTHASPAALQGAELPRAEPAPSDDAVRVLRSSNCTLNVWHNQTGVRTFRHPHDADGGAGFRVARTEPQ
jgi:hypothetical protein